MKYEDIPQPSKIVAVIKQKIFYKTEDGQLFVFEFEKLLNFFGDNEVTREIITNFNSVRIENGFFVFGEHYLGKDTIFQFSHQPDWDEFNLFLQQLKSKNELSVSQLISAIADAAQKKHTVK